MTIDRLPENLGGRMGPFFTPARGAGRATGSVRDPYVEVLPELALPGLRWQQLALTASP